MSTPHPAPSAAGSTTTAGQAVGHAPPAGRAPSDAGGGRARAPRGGIHGRQGLAGWVFVSPVVVILGLFLVAPIFMALWVSFSNWNGQGSPFASTVKFVGADNYARLITRPGLTQSDFMTSLRNNAWFVVFVVPLQTALALALAMLLNGKRLKAKGFFRTAYYFPSVTSSVAISVVFLFIFSSSGVVNALLSTIGVHGPSWFADSRGLFHVIVGAFGVSDDSPPSLLADHAVGGLSLWEWLSGPSVAMCSIIALVVWTTAGTFMLMFLAALQDIPVEVEEAASIDGANGWQRFRLVTFPLLKPTTFLVLTLGLIGTWQVFDQIYIISRGAPGKTTLTPAYLSYDVSFNNFDWGQGAAMAFILFAIIVALTLLQRWLLREKDSPSARSRRRRRRPAGQPS